MDNAFLHWFAGFVAGEGCFRIYARSTYYQCPLQISLRDDDLSILMEIQQRLQMGAICRYKGERQDRNDRPGALWTVAKIDDLVRLVEIFDAHPLRARKQKDYEIWREAVLERSKGRSRGGSAPTTYNREYLNYLAQKLKIIRAYDDADVEEFESGEEQLELPFYSKEEADGVVKEAV